MKRVVLLAGLAAVVVVPTALLVSSRPPAAQAEPQIYSAQQVLRVFGAQGIVLHRAPDDTPYTHRETFTAPGVAQLSVDVLHGAQPQVQVQVAASCQGLLLPLIQARGNVQIAWCAASKRESRRINAAVDRLRYSPADAALRPPPTFVLRPGGSRTVDVAATPAGAAVDCVNAAADASQPLQARMRASQIEVAEPSDAAGSRRTDYAFLSWQPISRSLVRFSCHSY